MGIIKRRVTNEIVLHLADPDPEGYILRNGVFRPENENAHDNDIIAAIAFGVLDARGSSAWHVGSKSNTFGLSIGFTQGPPRAILRSEYVRAVANIATSASSSTLWASTDQIMHGGDLAPFIAVLSARADTWGESSFGQAHIAASMIGFLDAVCWEVEMRGMPSFSRLEQPESEPNRANINTHVVQVL